MEGIAKIEAEPKLDNRNMIMVLAPDKRARQAAASRTANQHRGDRTPSTNGTPPADVNTTTAETAPADAAPADAAPADAAPADAAPAEAAPADAAPAEEG
jgi:hypothetical protein